jgi:hypothetical protein
MTVIRLILYFLLFLVLSSSKYQTFAKQSQMSYNEKNILDELDSISGVKLFPSFEISNFYPGNCRINLFADEKRWAVVFEILSYNTAGYNIVVDNYYFSNCFVKKEKHNNTNISTVILSQVDTQNLIDDEGFIKPNSNHISIRGQKYPLILDINQYKEKNIKGFYFEDTKSKIDIVSLMRLMAIKSPNLFKATESELRKNIPNDLPFLGSIENWHHLNYIASINKGFYIGKKPSEYETFQLIAKCIVNRSLEFYKPTLAPNTHWSNWPNAGQL